MKAYEVVNYALNMLGEGVVADAELESISEVILKCVNIAIDEVAQDYISPKIKEYMVVNGGEIDYSALRERVLEIVSVKKDDTKINFKMNTTSFSVDTNGLVEIEYKYLPKSCGLNDDIMLSPKVTPKTLALGACAEYSLMQGDYEQSVTYSDRFKNDLKCASPKVAKNVKIEKWL